LYGAHEVELREGSDDLNVESTEKCRKGLMPRIIISGVIEKKKFNSSCPEKKGGDETMLLKGKEGTSRVCQKERRTRAWKVEKAGNPKGREVRERRKTGKSRRTRGGGKGLRSSADRGKDGAAESEAQ